MMLNGQETLRVVLIDLPLTPAEYFATSKNKSGGKYIQDRLVLFYPKIESEEILLRTMLLLVSS